MDRDALINQRYLLVRPLGEGGMGEVYLVRDRVQGDRPLALKILRRDFDPGAVDRFKEEFRSTSRLRHPNLAEVYDFGEIAGDGRLFLTMEYVEGRDLQALDWSALAPRFDDLAVQCLRALDYIHLRGLLHNDIKPQNILVRPPFQVKLLDFGLARSVGDPTRPEPSGTLHYLAPERLQGRAPDGRSDLYSLGVVLYERLCGALPFQGKDAGQVIGAILAGKPRAPRAQNPAAPERLERFVMALIARDPAARPASAGAALELLNRGSEAPASLDTPETYASLVGSGRFVGRDGDLASLFDLAAAVVLDPSIDDGRPRVVLIDGPSGIGKSRLLREMKNRLQLAGIRTLTGRCYEDGGVPFQPFVEILRQLPGRADLPPEMRAALDQVLPAEAGAGSSTGSGAAAAGDLSAERADKSTFLAALAATLDRLGGDRPGVLVLEDLHWGDGPGVELLEHLLLRPRRAPWLFVGSVRDDEAEKAPIGDFVKRFAPFPQLRRVSLRPLDAEQVTDLLASMVPFEERPVRLARLLIERSEGNPLFLEELMRSLAEDGTLRRRGAAWFAESRTLDAIRLPQSLAAVVGRRLAGLSRRQREIASLLAVFNRPVPPDLLLAALGREPAPGQGAALGGDAEGAVETAEALARLHVAALETGRDGSTLYVLAHSRIRDAVYRGLDDDRRRALHAAAGRALEEVSRAALDEVVEELAHHFTQAGDAARATDYLLRAAARADALFNFQRQATHLARALDLLPAGDPRRLDALMELTLTRSQDLGDYPAALECARRLQREARAAEDRAREVIGLCQEGWALGYLGEPDEALERARRGLALARASKDTSLIIRGLNIVGTLHARRGQHRLALKFADEAASLAESIGQKRFLVSALNNAALNHVGLGEAETGRAILERSLAIAKENGLAYHYHRNLPNLGIVLQETGDLPGALRVMDESFLWAREHGNIELISLQLSGLGQLYAQRGLFDRALRTFSEERAMRRQLNDEANQIQLFDFLGSAEREIGRLPDALAAHREGLELARRLGSRLQEGHLLSSLAFDLVETGALHEAGESAGSALAIGRELAHPRITFFALAGLARVATRAGDRREAAAAVRRLGRLDLTPLRFPDRLLHSYVLAQSALTAGRPADAEREARLASATAGRAGYREHEWRFRALLGDVFSARGLPDDATDAYNAALSVIRQVVSEIEDPAVAQDYEQDERRREIARKAAEGERPFSTARPGAGDTQAARGSPAASIIPGGAAPLPGAVAVAADAPVRMLATIYEITQIINSILDLKELLEKVMDLAIEIVRAERGLIFLYRSETDEMEMVVARNMERQTIKDATEYSRSILREVGRGRPILSHDAVTDSRFREYRSVSMYHIRSLLCVPLRHREKVIGTVYVDTRQPGVVFTEDDLKFLETFANQAAIAIENARLYEQIRQENQYLKQAVQERYGFENIIGRSGRMREVFSLISRVSQSNLPVLIRGESGTGKELVARAIHHNSPRSQRRYFSENCAALPDTLLESELFGHSRGAFTGADSTHKGLFELADGGTLFLDEVGDMSVALQSKLLRALQDGEIRPVGSEATRRVDVRIISATNRDLEMLVKQKTFREDLYFRLNVISIRLPALRERSEDIPLLVDHFLGKVARENSAPKLRVDPTLMALLTRYDWPGNVRELENAVSKLALFASGDTLLLRDAKHDTEFFNRVTHPTGTAGVDAGLSLDDLERALTQAKGNRVTAARLLGVSRATMFRKLRQYGIPGTRPTRPVRRGRAT
jgi:Nif-specific regulatory protein